MRLLIIGLALMAASAFGQEIKVEYDKKHDFSNYKTFSFGPSEVATPPDQKQVSDATIDKWIKSGVTRELEAKGMTRVDSAGDLIATYTLVTLDRSDAQAIGPLGMTPGSNDRTWSRSYKQTSVIIDLNTRKNYLAWRVNAVVDIVGAEAERTIDLIVMKGFKKFHLKKK